MKQSKKKVKMTEEQENFNKEIKRLFTLLDELGVYWESEEFGYGFPNKVHRDGSLYEYGHIHIYSQANCPKSIEDDDERPCPVLHIYIKEDEYEENGYSFCYYINDTVQYTNGRHYDYGESRFTKTMLKEMIVELNKFARKQYKDYLQYA